MVWPRPTSLVAHGILVAYSALAVGPILLVAMNSFKARDAIFGAPLAPPSPATFSLVGYAKVLGVSHMGTYFANSLIVTLVSMAFVLLLGAMELGGLPNTASADQRCSAFFSRSASWCRSGWVRSLS